MEIRIRTASDDTSRLLADVPFRPDVIDKIIPTLGAWGVLAEGGLYEEKDLMGQFVDDGKSAYFEVVVGVGE